MTLGTGHDSAAHSSVTVSPSNASAIVSGVHVNRGLTSPEGADHTHQQCSRRLLRPRCALPLPADRRCGLSLTCRRRTEPRTYGNMHKNLAKIPRAWFRRYHIPRGQTDIQTDILFTMLRNRSRGRSNKVIVDITLRPRCALPPPAPLASPALRIFRIPICA